MGKASRDKGYRSEYNLVKILEKQGYNAVRVPLSGATTFAKGDIAVYLGMREIKVKGFTVYTKDPLILEVKSRKKDFKRIYEAALIPGTIDKYSLLTSEFYITGSLKSMLTLLPIETDNILENDIVRKSILEKKKWLQGADILVLKRNNDPYIYIRYK